MTPEEKYLYEQGLKIIKSLKWEKGFGFSENLVASDETYKLIVDIFKEGFKKGYRLGSKGKNV